MNITKTSIERPTLIVVVFSVLIFLGLLSYAFLSYELVPKFTPGVITVTTVYPGASPTEVENTVSRRIEDALSAVENVEQITAISQESFSLVRLELTPGADVDQTLQNAQRRVNAMLNILPEGIQMPALSRFDFDDLPVMRIGVFSTLSATEFYDLATNQLQPALAQVEGVAQVQLLGGREREIQVNVDTDKLNYYGISLLQVVQAVRTANLDFPTGKLQNREGQVFIRLSGRFQSLDQLRALVVTITPTGTVVRVKDVAEVRDTQSEIAVISRTNGQNALGIEIKKQSDANAVDMSAGVQERIAQLEAAYQDIGLNFQIAQDTSEFTLQAANAVMLDLTYAIILVSLVMLIFLHSLRNSLIVLISIPTSIISTFIVMYVLGYTLNLLSLLGLSLAIGILVDDSIVVIENIYRHLEMGKNRVKAAFEGRMEIGFTALSITLIDVVVFLPIVFAQGLVADLLRQYAVVIITSTLMSLFVSFTLVPLLVSRFGKLEEINEQRWWGKMAAGFERGIDKLIEEMIKALHWAFGHKTITLLIALVLFVAAIALVPLGFIGTEFTKAGDRGEFIVEIELPKDATVDRTNQVARQAENYLLQLPEVVSVFTNVGTTSSGRIARNSSYLAELSVKLTDKTERAISAAFLARQVKIDLEGSIPGIRVRPIEVNILGLRSDDAVQLTLNGPQLEPLLEFSEVVMDTLAAIPGALEVNSTVGEGSPEVSVTVDRDRMASFGIGLDQVGGVMQTAFSGNRDARYREGDFEYPINIQLDAFDRQRVENICNLQVMDNQGQLIPLKLFADIQETETPAQLERTNRLPSVTIKSQVVGRPSGTVGNELKEKLAAMDIPEGITYSYGGQTQRQTEGFQTLIIALITSVFLVYLIMVALYESYVYPFVVLFSIPLAVIGALLVLALAKQSLSIFSMLGLLMLVGLVGKNAILVVDFTNQLKAEGMELQAALTQATRLRFRPILMTNLTMVIGLLPIALATGAGSEWKNGLAWALIGGLSSSMFLSLIIVPLIYYLTDRTLVRWGWQERKKVKVS